MKLGDLFQLLVVVLAFLPSKGFAWQSIEGSTIPTDVSIQMDTHHNLLVWFRIDRQIEVEFTKHTLLRGLEVSDASPIFANVDSVEIDHDPGFSMTAPTFSIPIPSDVRKDFNLPATADKFSLLLAIYTIPPYASPDGTWHVSLDARDSSDQAVRVLLTGEELQYPFSNPNPAFRVGASDQYFCHFIPPLELPLQFECN